MQRGRCAAAVAQGEELREKGVGADMRDDGGDAERTELTCRLHCYEMMCQYHVRDKNWDGLGWWLYFTRFQWCRLSGFVVRG